MIARHIDDAVADLEDELLPRVQRMWSRFSRMMEVRPHKTMSILPCGAAIEDLFSATWPEVLGRTHLQDDLDYHKIESERKLWNREDSGNGEWYRWGEQVAEAVCLRGEANSKFFRVHLSLGRGSIPRELRDETTLLKLTEKDQWLLLSPETIEEVAASQFQSEMYFKFLDALEMPLKFDLSKERGVLDADLSTSRKLMTQLLCGILLSQIIVKELNNPVLAAVNKTLEKDNRGAGMATNVAEATRPKVPRKRGAWAQKEPPPRGSKWQPNGPICGTLVELAARIDEKDWRTLEGATRMERSGSCSSTRRCTRFGLPTTPSMQSMDSGNGPSHSDTQNI